MPKVGEGGKPVRSTKPVIVNRGGTGLLHKLPEHIRQQVEEKDGKRKIIEVPVVRNKIDPGLKSMIVPIDSVTLDPDNARLHPERNLEAIKQSLCQYGQVKPVVVRKQTMIVVAGNGTVEAARDLGWTKIAANIVSMSAIEAIGYGLADNRTAELARWDVGTVTRLDRLLQEANQPSIGWSEDELIALRLTDWVEPPDDFPDVDDQLETDHVCPKCGYRFSGGDKVAKNGNGDGK